MKKIILFVLVFAVSGAVFGQEFTFRGFPWGSTAEEIIAKEGQPDRNDDGFLIYRDVTIAGYKARLLFYCWPSVHRLYMGSYEIYISQNKDDPRNIYNDLLGKLSLLYGQSTRETNTLAAYEHYWVVSRTKITLSMFTTFGIAIDIQYKSPEISGYENL